jgi:anti-sigma factor RsiW
MIRACADWQGEIGAYIVGALDERTTAAVSQHLASCAGCRAEYHELAPVRGGSAG